MNIFRNIIFKYIILSILLLFNLDPALFAIKVTLENNYQEQVFLNYGRDTYITGEDIWFEAYCINNTSTSSPVLSKVMYIELINDNNEHILGQILYIDENSANSNITIPDTLQTGLYYLKAYTQWMVNFGPESFFSTPLFIYNQFDEKPANQLASLKLPAEPKIYIEGLKIIGGIKNKVAVSFPELKGKETSINLVETESNTIFTTFITDKDGEGKFVFIPMEGHKYVCTATDSLHGNFLFKLPEILSSGYKIDIISSSENNVTLRIGKLNAESQKLELYIKSGNTSTLLKTIKQEDLEKELIVPYVFGQGIINEIELKDTYGKILAANRFIYLPENPINIPTLRERYTTREAVNLKIQVDKNSDMDLLKASVSVHKTKPSFQLSESLNNFPYSTLEDIRYSKIQDKFYILMPEYFPEFNLSNTPQIIYTDTDNLLPVEDMGILISGVVTDTKSKTPIHGLEVIFSKKDTIPDLQSALTDQNGEFALLLNEFGTQPCFFHIYKDNQPFIDPIEITIDKKFYYQRNTVKYTLVKTIEDSAFVSGLKDEAQRVIIQRVFTKKENTPGIGVRTIQQKSSYFDNSLITVYPDDFFDMPNFEEIAREILPLVRFKKAEDGCTISIFNPEPGVRSLVPLVLVDGVPIINKCDLYNLNSGLINKINIQSQPRIVGNLYYDGLISVTSSANKEFKYSKTQNSYSFKITGYTQGKAFDVTQKSGGLKNSEPEFKNQLLWQTFNFNNKNDYNIDFYTSDEEGEYIVEISGISKNGIPVHLHQTFTVTAK